MEGSFRAKLQTPKPIAKRSSKVAGSGTFVSAKVPEVIASGPISESGPLPNDITSVPEEYPVRVKVIVPELFDGLL